MSDKYIIRNCPNLTTSYYGTGETIHNQCDLTDDDLCANCTDCVMKQIVELCKEESSIIQHKQKIKVKGLNKLADRIFELLDIQEVE